MRLRNYSECPSETARNASGSSRPLRLCRPNLVPSSARQAFFHHSAVMWDGPAIKARRQRHGGAGILERPREPALTRIAALRLWIAGLRAPASPPTCENIRDSAKDWRTCSQPAPLTSVRIDSRLGSFYLRRGPLQALVRATRLHRGHRSARRPKSVSSCGVSASEATPVASICASSSRAKVRRVTLLDGRSQGASPRQRPWISASILPADRSPRSRPRALSAQPTMLTRFRRGPKRALAAAKARGVTLGGPKLKQARKAAVASLKASRSTRG